MHPRFLTAFAHLADNLQSALAPILADHHFPAMLTAEQVSTLKNTAGLAADALAVGLVPLSRLPL
ncbi:cytidine deaminase, partial [Salmonella enterica subsp. enterica serovar Wilhelmsburg]